MLQGYEPFGSLLPGRNYSSDSYRFGFQGQVKDDEVYGATGTSYAFKYRMHDARVGRFWSLDPLASKYPFYSPYAFSGNRVIDMIELEGLEPVMLPGVGLGKHALPLLSNVRPVTSLREYGENLEQYGANVQMASLPLVLANPVAAEAVSSAAGLTSVIGTMFQAAADFKEGKNTEGVTRVAVAVAFHGLGSASNKAVDQAKLPEGQAVASKISIGIVLGKAEEATMSVLDKNATESSNNSSQSTSTSSTSTATLPVVPVRTNGTDQLAP